MDILPNQLGYLLLEEDGTVIAVIIPFQFKIILLFSNCNQLLKSNGDLENDERLGMIIVKILKSASKQELGLSEDGKDEGFQRLTSTPILTIL